MGGNALAGNVLGGAGGGAALPAIRVRAYSNVNLSIPFNSATPLALNAERWDSHGMHDVTTNNTRLTCVQDGLYTLGGSASLENNAGQYDLIMRLNGVTNIGHKRLHSIGTMRTQTVGGDYVLAVGDYIEMLAYRNGAVVNILTIPNYSP